MNFKALLAALLAGAAKGASEGLSSETGTVNWQSVGIVAAFGALAGLVSALGAHPAVVAAEKAALTAA